MITERPSVRLHAPSGGHTSFNIFKQQSGSCQQASGGQQTFNSGVGSDTYFAHGSRPNSMSSNAYASGQHQNTGNHITERSSTRRLAPPGGRTQIAFS
jgi:SPIRAL1-like protein